MKLTPEEDEELSYLAWLVVADMPMTSHQALRYNEIKEKRDEN